MTAFWISLAGVVIVFASWRLRRASGTVDRILREEHDRSGQEPAGDEPSVEHQTH
jgi:hypothetical protein